MSAPTTSHHLPLSPGASTIVHLFFNHIAFLDCDIDVMITVNPMHDVFPRVSFLCADITVVHFVIPAHPVTLVSESALT